MSGPSATAPPPAPPVVLVATTAEVLAHPDLHVSMLAPWERRRLAGIRIPGRRDDVVAARLLLRLGAARFTGRPPREVEPAQLCPTCRGAGHGRPYLPGYPGVGASYSHADGLVAAAVATGPVGIDVEPLARRPGSLSALRRMLSGAEAASALAEPEPGPALLRLWVRREALLKAGRDDLELTEWTDHHRRAVVALATGPAGRVRVPGPGPCPDLAEQTRGARPRPSVSTARERATGWSAALKSGCDAGCGGAAAAG